MINYCENVRRCKCRQLLCACRERCNECGRVMHEQACSDYEDCEESAGERRHPYATKVGEE